MWYFEKKTHCVNYTIIMSDSQFFHPIQKQPPEDFCKKRCS